VSIRRTLLRPAKKGTERACDSHRPHDILGSREGEAVDGTVEALIADLLEWVASRERTYEEVMEAWRTSCPKLPVWEDANDRGLIMTEYVNGRSIVKATPLGFALLEKRKVNSRR
jgi:D-3-phosphoglycerate dehydrogenase